MEPKNKKEIRIRHESDASKNATTIYFYYKNNDYVHLVQNAIIHDEINSLKIGRASCRERVSSPV